MVSKRNVPHKTIPAAAFKSRSIEKLACQVPEAVRTELAQLGKAYRAQVGEIIFRKGQPSRGVFLIVSGRVALSTDDAPIQITRIGEPGSLVGVPATINNRTYSLTAEAVEKTDLIHIGIAEFKHLLKNNSALCYSIVSMLSQEIRSLRLPEMIALNVRCAGDGNIPAGNASGKEPVPVLCQK
jgi:CRP-like cAMP-binding protein